MSCWSHCRGEIWGPEVFDRTQDKRPLAHPLAGSDTSVQKTQIQLPRAVAWLVVCRITDLIRSLVNLRIYSLGHSLLNVPCIENFRLDVE